MTPAIEFLRPVVAIAAAAGVWLGDKVIASISPPPDSGWGMVLAQYGLPIVLLALSIYGGLGMYRALRASEAARLQDAKDALAQYRADSEKAQEARKELIREVRAQTDVISKGQQ
jgi:hypothetical protein